MKFVVKYVNMVNAEGSLKANVVVDYGELTFEAKVMDGKNGLFVSMPQRVYEKDGEKKYKDLIYPHSKEGREELVASILEAYNEAVASAA